MTEQEEAGTQGEPEGEQDGEASDGTAEVMIIDDENYEDYVEGDDDNEATEDNYDEMTAMGEIADALSVTAKKVKNVTLGSGWTTKPKSSASAKPKWAPRSTTASSASSSSRPPPSKPGFAGRKGSSGAKGMTKQEYDELLKTHPCSICGRLGH